MTDPWLTIATTIITSGLLFASAFVVQWLKNRNDSPQTRADATEKLQRVIAGMGAVYDELVSNIQEVVEAQVRIKLEAEMQSKIEKDLQEKIEGRYRARIDGLEKRIAELEATELSANIGIGLLIAQLVGLNIPPAWRPKEK